MLAVLGSPSLIVYKVSVDVNKSLIVHKVSVDVNKSLIVHKVSVDVNNAERIIAPASGTSAVK